MKEVHKEYIQFFLGEAFYYPNLGDFNKFLTDPVIDLVRFFMSLIVLKIFYFRSIFGKIFKIDY